METIEKLYHLKIEVEGSKNFRGKAGVIRKIDRFISLLKVYKSYPVLKSEILRDCKSDYNVALSSLSRKEIRTKAEERQRKLF